METTQNHEASQQTTRRAAVGGLAVVGFVALILIGIATAIYAASFLPKAFLHLSSANVYLSSLVQPTGDNQLQAVNPTTPVTSTPAPTSISLSPATTTTTVVTPTYTPAPTPTYTAPKPTYVPPTYTQPTYHVVTVPAVQNYYGLPDLVTTITSVGYLRTNGDTSSFVAANTVPSGYEGAVRFVVANRGTNVSGSWNFDADLPTNDNNSNYHSANQQSIKPGDSIVYTLGFDNSNRGSETVRIMADNNDRVNESNENNNDDSASIYFNGTSSNTNYNNNTSQYDSNGNYCSYGTYYQNSHYYCNTSGNNNNSNNNDNSHYNSNGDYCTYGTYYQNSHYYCNSSSGSTNNNTNHYDSNGQYCSYGTYYQNGHYYCDSSTGNTSNSTQYDSNGNYCSYGTYYQNQHYYCN